MKFNLIEGSLNDLNHPIETVLTNRGIKDIQRYIHPTLKDCESFNSLDNIDKAYEIFIEHISNRDYIQILVDCDCDGFTSAAILYDYIVNNYNYDDNIGFILHSKKVHGLSDTDVREQIDERTRLLIIPDASSNEEELHEEYAMEFGLNIIVLDHHQCDDGYSEFATVVNNQLSDNYANKNLSGVGVVYKFLEKCDYEMDIWTYQQVTYAKDYLDMVAVGLIGDVMNLSSIENRYLVRNGLTINLTNSFLKTVMQKESYSLGVELTPIKVAFNIVPLINALIRVGEYEEQLVLFKAMCNFNETCVTQSRKGEVTETIQEKALRLCKNAKNRQRRARDNAHEIICDQLGEYELPIVIADVTNVCSGQFTGLVAIKVAEKYNRPTLLYRHSVDEDGNECFTGSGRNPDTSGLDDFRNYCLDTGVFEFCQGHANAFGFKIKKENMEVFKELIKNQNINREPCVYVDFITDLDDIPSTCFLDIYKMRKIWGTGVEEPKAFIGNISCSSDNISISDKGYMKIKIDDIELVQLGVNETHPLYKFINDLWDEVIDLDFDVIGSITINDWQGKLTKQIRIEEVFNINVTRR